MRPLESPAHAFLLIGSTLGVLFLLASPPFQVPDEPQHFYRAFQVSELQLFPRVILNADRTGGAPFPGALLPKSLAALVDQSDVVATRFRPENKLAPSKFPAMLHAPLDPADREYLPVARYPPVAYAPQAVGIAVGRGLGASPLVLFYLGRLFALSAWVACVFLAISYTPVLKWTYFLLALMPMTLHLAASNSADSVVIGVAFLLSARLLSWAYDPVNVNFRARDCTGLFVMALALTLSKALYLPLLSLFLLIPGKKFSSRTSRWLILGALVISCVVTHLAWNSVARWMTAPGPSVELERHAVDGSPLPGAAPEQLLAFVLSRPLALARTLEATIFSRTSLGYLVTFVGALGWLDTRLPFWLPYIYAATLIAVSVLGGSPERVSWRARCLAAGVFALTALVALVVVYTGQPAAGGSTVREFQGRYLIPIAPLLLLVFCGHDGRLRITRAIAAVLIVFVVLTASIAGYSLIRRFYLPHVPSKSLRPWILNRGGPASSTIRPMRILTTLPQDDLTSVPAAARAAEAAGYDGLVTSENRHDPFLSLGVAAVNTSRVGLCTGIAIAFSRSPMPVANASWDLQVASRGRFALGLGSQVRAHNENRFSVPWSPPAPRLREYVDALRAIWRCWEKGETLAYRGQHYKFTLMTPNFTPTSQGQPMVPVTIAAVGPAMLRLAGEACDGVRLHGFCTRRYVDEVVLRELRAGWARSGRLREEFEIAGGGFIATGPDDESVAKMFEWVRTRVAFYGSTPAYWPVLEVHGLHELGRKLNVMAKAGQWDRMAAEIPDDVVRLFAAVGTHRELAREIETRFGGVGDSVTLSGGYGIRQDIPPDLIQDVRKIPTAFSGFRTAW